MARGCAVLLLLAVCAQAAAAANTPYEYGNFLEALTRSNSSKMMEQMAQSLMATPNEGMKMMERAFSSMIDPASVQSFINEANRGASQFFNPIQALFSTSQFQNRETEGAPEGAVTESTPQRVFPFFFPFTGAPPAAKFGPRYEFHDHIYECGGRPCDETFSISHSYSHSHSVSRED